MSSLPAGPAENFPRRKATAAGCKWFIVEQDTCPGDPFECIKRNFDYLKGLCE
ncbi:MAG: hypothetical protein WAL87_07850 [Chthoniobacterales bacterium]